MFPPLRWTLSVSESTIGLTVTLIVEYGIKTNYMCLGIMLGVGVVVSDITPCGDGGQPDVSSGAEVSALQRRAQRSLATVSESGPPGFKIAT